MSKRYLVILPLLAALGGCSLPQVVDESMGQNALIEGLYAYGAGGRDLKLDVSGLPFAMPEAAFQEAVESLESGKAYQQLTKLISLQ